MKESSYFFSNFIGGVFQPQADCLPVYEPATGKIYAHVANSTEKDAESAIQAAKTALPAWSSLNAEQRAQFLVQIADALEKRAHEFAEAESLNTGKPISLASKVDIPRAIANFRFFAASALQMATECHNTPGLGLNYTLRQPVGVVTCISPWNLPLYLLTWKIAPALAFGNTVVAKPSEITPHTAWLFAQLCESVGLPAGVVNIIHGQGDRTGNILVTHPNVNAVSFTGSTRTGALINTAAAPHFKKVSLELGGKNAFIIFDQADLKLATQTALKAAFSNQGQICLCGSRILIQKSIYDQCKSMLLEQIQTWQVNDPSLTQTTFGAMVSKPHFDKVMSCIDLAKQEGGKILCGGQVIQVPGRCENGWFIAPTLIENLSPACSSNQEEIFGPVATLIPFETEAEAISIANGTVYGLAASVWSQDITQAHRVAHQLQSGSIWINNWMIRDLRTPFGGMKHSGIGREGGLDAMRFYTEAKNIFVNIPSYPS